MTSYIKSSAIIVGILVVIAYAVYRYVIKRGPDKPISFEDILNKAVLKIKEVNVTDDNFELCILPPSKAKLFISENPDFINDFSLQDIKNKVLVIWFIKSSSDIIYQEALVSDSLSSDFTDIVPLDKVYKKVIKIRNQ